MDAEQKFTQIAVYFLNKVGGSMGLPYLVVLVASIQMVGFCESIAKNEDVILGDDDWYSPALCNRIFGQEYSNVSYSYWNSLIDISESNVYLRCPVTEFDFLLLSMDEINNMDDAYEHFSSCFQKVDVHWNCPVLKDISVHL